MPTTFVKGDLFEDSKSVPAPRAFAFGADVSGAMKEGIAIAFKKKWPALADAFRAHATEQKMQLGDVFAWREGEEVVYALALHRDDEVPTVAALKRALDAMLVRAAADGVSRIALPNLGTKMDRARVKKLLTETGDASPISVMVFEQFIRTKTP